MTKRTMGPRASPTAERIQLKDPTLSTTSPGGIQLLDQQPSDSFVGVNRRPHVALLIHKSIAPRDEQYCDGCSYLEQGNSRCELFDMHLGNDEEMPCGEGWFRTTQCLEAAGEAKLYQVKTNGIEHG